MRARGYRSEDARFDAMVEDWTLRETGVVEPDEPTAYSHWAWTQQYEKAAQGEFSPAEREAIRARLGLGPFAGDEPGEEGQ